MHCHNQDQTFYLVDGQATLHFPDGGHETLKPGMHRLYTVTISDKRLLVKTVTSRNCPKMFMSPSLGTGCARFPKKLP